jgi:L-ascorbate metabolism protein UlaG (beta-lactamase superfamily)
MARWKFYADWAKQRPAMLRLADRLGRNRGRLAVLDRLAPPPPAPVRPDLSRWTSHKLAAIWIGHATMLLRIGGQTVLTDPVMSNRVGLGLAVMTAGPRRRFAPAIDLHALPPIDLLLMSHAHFDHLDRPTLSRLPKRIPVITSMHTADLFRDLGYRSVRELDWGESADAGTLRVKSLPVVHWGARTFLDDHRGYCAYTIESLAGDGRRILFGADSAYQELWKPEPKVDLAIVGIGGYNPYIRGHANPEQAWEMASFVQPDAVIPMHHSTFKLSYEPWEEPMQRFLAAAGEEVNKVVVRQIGGQWGA